MILYGRSYDSQVTPSKYETPRCYESYDCGISSIDYLMFHCVILTLVKVYEYPSGLTIGMMYQSYWSTSLTASESPP